MRCWSRRGSRPSKYRLQARCWRRPFLRLRADTVAFAESEGAEERVGVLDFHPNVLILIAEFQRMSAFGPGEAHLGIEQGRILPLGIGALPAEAAEAPRDADGRQAAGNGGVGGKAGNHDGIVADGEGVFSGLGPESPRRASSTLFEPITWV